MREINIGAINNIESRCTSLEQAANTLWLIIESLEDAWGGKDDNTIAALSFWTRREVYQNALYLIYREVSGNVESIRAEVEGNLICGKESEASA